MSTFSSQSACPTTDNPAFVPGSYIVQPPITTAAATAFHQQANAALPAGFRADTYSDSTSRTVSATVYSPANEWAACRVGTADEVLNELATLSFPATDAFPRR